MRVLPNYLVTYLPIVTVMLVNPILYRQSSKEIDRQLVSRFSQITAQERQIMNKFKMKFVMITVVFYVCWMPNIINGIVLWSSWSQLPVKFVVFNWYLMAMLNPLQAFFNALVYRKWDCTFKITELKSPVVSEYSLLCFVVVCSILSLFVVVSIFFSLCVLRPSIPFVKVPPFDPQEVGQHPQTKVGRANTTVDTAQLVEGIDRTTTRHQLCGLPANL
jgi:Ocular albinism type 1 protein